MNAIAQAKTENIPLGQAVIRRNELQNELDRIVKEALAQIRDRSDVLSAEIRALNNYIADTVNTRAAEVRQMTAKPYGVLNLTVDGVAVKQEISKRVKWDQGELARVRERIERSGDDPTDYIKTELSVDERKYTSWPKAIQNFFTDARTVTPGPAVIRELVVEQ